MPWFTLHDMTETDLRAFYRYVRSLGPAGNPAPAYVPPAAHVQQEPVAPAEPEPVMKTAEARPDPMAWAFQVEPAAPAAEPVTEPEPVAEPEPAAMEPIAEPEPSAEPALDSES